MHSVIKNHPMIDGNKRTAWILMVTFMALNGLDVQMSTANGMKLTIGLATDELTLDQAAELIKKTLGSKKLVLDKALNRRAAANKISVTKRPHQVV